MADEIVDVRGLDGAGAIRVYNGHRLNVDNALHKATTLDAALAAQFSERMEQDLERALGQGEVQAGKSKQLANYLTQLNHARAAALNTEADENQAAILALWDALYARRRQYAAEAAAAQQAAQQPQAAAPVRAAQVKPVEALKPRPLANDASTADLTLWTQQFRAYYSASNIDQAPITNQHAYFYNCLDRELGKIVSRDTGNQDPVFGPAPSLIKKVEAFFQRRHPPLLRRQKFFQARQQAGQGSRDYLESLRSAAEEADIAGMGIDDAICVMLVSGLSDMKLVEKLTEVEQPTLQRFVQVVDSYMHAHAASGAVGAAAQAGRPGQGQGKKGQNQQSNRQRPQVSEEEKKRRASLFGKCFRCASSDHQGKDCKHSRDVVCNKCHKPGHVTPACSQTLGARQARQTAAEDTMSSVSQQQSFAPPYYYMPPDFGQPGPPQANANAVTAVAHSRRTPPLNL